MSCGEYDVIVIGGGHAGAEAAWAASGLGVRTALVTMDPSKIGAMSCNPAIGGLAKGQMVREIDALGGLMGLAADATGIQFRVLNASKGQAVRGPRCQSDKYRYALEVQRLLATRANLDITAGSVQEILVEEGRVTGVVLNGIASPLRACSVVLTTGTFMRGLMHTGERKAAGGRVGEEAAIGISAALLDLGFELGRLKTGTPPRLAAETIDFDVLAVQEGDDEPVPFSDLTDPGCFPALEQRPCHITWTGPAVHEQIRSNLHRAPMYNGQIETAGPRYCPSIEDKIVRFAHKSEHQVFLEPESLSTNEIYCNGISTSLPVDVQDCLVRSLPGCEQASILRYGYAVEYDMVWPYQIDATCMTKKIEGLLLAGQINGTSGYEEAAGQGLLAGINAARYGRAQDLVRLRRDQAYIGVMMDDLVTKMPREPYRMFTSRAEFRLLLRADNADERLTRLGRDWGLVEEPRWTGFCRRTAALGALRNYLASRRIEGKVLLELLRRPETTTRWVLEQLKGSDLPAEARDHRLISRLVADVQYAGYIDRHRRDLDRLAAAESSPLPLEFDYREITGLRREAEEVLNRFRPATLGQAGRLSGVNPADLMLVNMALRR